jgi:methyl farnesoate epoxidase/farnesoate epoxidase
MQAQIEAEAKDLVTRLRNKCNGGLTPVELHDAFDVCVLNSLWAMLAGERFSLDDTRMMELLDIVHSSFRMIDTSGGLLNQMPFLRFIAPGWSGYTRLLSVLNRMWSFLRVSNIRLEVMSIFSDHVLQPVSKCIHGIVYSHGFACVCVCVYV